MRPACRLYSPVRTVRTCAVPTFILPPGLLLRMVTDAAHRIDTLSSLFFCFVVHFIFVICFPLECQKEIIYKGHRIRILCYGNNKRTGVGIDRRGKGNGRGASWEIVSVVVPNASVFCCCVIDDVRSDDGRGRGNVFW